MNNIIVFCNFSDFYSMLILNFQLQTAHSDECVFMEKMLENFYNTYSSCRYSNRKRKWFVALNRRGRRRRGNRSRRKHKYAQFLVLHLDADQTYAINVGPPVETDPRTAPAYGPKDVGLLYQAPNVGWGKYHETWAEQEFGPKFVLSSRRSQFSNSDFRGTYRSQRGRHRKIRPKIN